jgi:predicted RNA binding protein YcfA (HicA-like mRNA interferase family)
MKYRDIVKIIEQDGWVLTRSRGSHRHYGHPIKPAILNSILKQTGLK